LESLNLETDTGVNIFAIKRDTDWIFAPDRETQILRGDVVFGEGPEEGIERVYEMATRREFEHKGAVSSSIEDLDRAVMAIVEMKNMSELAVGLGYISVLSESDEMAGEVQVLESKTDNLKESLELWVLECAKRLPETDLKKLRGLIHLAISSEVITDAALEMADTVMRDIDAHPVLAEAIRESNEIITRVNVEDGAEIVSLTLGELALETETGMHVMAIRRNDDEWVYNPRADTRIEAGDTLIVRGTRAGEERLKEITEA
ncbi:MAG: TrkA C-terminal domain-containing protein, partial [Halobacteria archaeon]|nr:TrkA C-terminal domain-containing protein [Halobacteria archaeon]